MKSEWNERKKKKKKSCIDELFTNFEVVCLPSSRNDPTNWSVLFYWAEVGEIDIIDFVFFSFSCVVRKYTVIAIVTVASVPRTHQITSENHFSNSDILKEHDSPEWATITTKKGLGSLGVLIYSSKNVLCNFKVEETLPSKMEEKKILWINHHALDLVVYCCGRQLENFSQTPIF